jgi:hypothetical protein
MVGTLITIAIFWLAFNIAFACMVILRVNRHKRLIRENSIDRLMATSSAAR